MINDELLKNFYESPHIMERFRRAVSELRDIGFESLARRLGEPLDNEYDNQFSIQASAFDNAKRQGWYAVLSLIFNIDSYMAVSAASQTAPDFGAENMLKMLAGVSDRELAELDE